MANHNLKKPLLTIPQRVWDRAVSVINALDEIFDEVDELGFDGKELIFDLGAGVINLYDAAADLVEWITTKTFILFARKAHEARIRRLKYRKEILKYFLGAVIVATGIISLFAFITGYQYTYNGRTLGIVKDQQDVLEILDLISEELTQEYGSNITIDPEEDIVFTPVISYGKEIDDEDTVLRRFTYMGDIQAKAYGLYADDELLAILENEVIAEEVLDMVLNNYLDDRDSVKYEKIGFAEEIEIKPLNTTVSNVTSKNSAFNKIRSGGQQEVTYTVKAGDTTYGICEKLGVSLKELMSMNEGLNENTTLHVGDKFVISQEVPLLTVQTVQVSTFSESVDYEVKYKKSDSYYEGEQVVVQAGKKGKARVTARLTKHNGKTVKKKVLEKEIIIEPVDKIVVKGTKKVPPKKGTGTFIRPVNVPVYSGYGWRWGRMHLGIDLPTSVGVPIRAADGGTVTYAGWYYSYGYTIMIDHGGNMTTLYAHCNSLNVSVGEKVFQGQQIATVGNTGRSTGPHCHFEVKVNGANVNPSNYV